MKKRVGIFGGTFNPIHNGHLIMAEAARREYKLSKVYFVPCAVPPHKPKEELFPVALRYKLVQKAISKKNYFKVLNIEIKKKKPAYTIDTIKKLKSNLALYFLIGADEFEKLRLWKKPDELAKLVTFLVLPRPSKNIKPPKVKNLSWSLVNTKPVSISSSEVRRRIDEKRSIKGLVPDVVSRQFSN